jgi:hypothetical protein
MFLPLSNRKGFALPMAILVITVLSAALAAAFISTSGEYTTNSAERGQNRAYNLARTGLQQFLVLRSQPGWCSNCGDPIQVDSEWTRVSLTGGYADVVAVKVRPALDSSTPAIYFIRSRGVDTSVKLNAAGMSVAAEHTVGVYAKWQMMEMKVTAAWTSLSGMVKNGTGTISGIDQCGVMPSVAGVQVDSADIVIKGGSANFLGNPPYDTLTPFNQLKSNSNIDWASILNGSIPPDIEIPGQSFPSATQFADTNYWPVIRIHTNGYSLPNAGRGIIIADSDFTISGSNMWSGIIMVGGALTSNGINTVYGSTLSGLNLLTGGTPSISTVDDSYANGTKSYVYDSCSVAKAAARMRKYVPMPNTWTDNLASW